VKTIKPLGHRWFSMENWKVLKETEETQWTTQHSLMKPMQSNEKPTKPWGNQWYSMINQQNLKQINDFLKNNHSLTDIIDFQWKTQHASRKTAIFVEKTTKPQEHQWNSTKNKQNLKEIYDFRWKAQKSLRKFMIFNETLTNP